MNILEIQAELEYWPDQKLIQEAQQPTGAAPTYLVITEGERRNKERQAYEAEMAKQQQPQPTVAEETMMELGGGQSMGGIPDVDPNMMQNQMMAQQMPQQQQMQQQMPQQMPQGQPMAMRGGGAIRYQGGEYIDPNLVALGWTIDEEGNLVPVEEQAGLQGPFGNTILGPEGWLLDTDVYTGTGKGGFGLGRPDNPYTERGWARTGNIALDLAKVKLAQKGLKATKGAFDKAGGFKGMTKGIRDKYKEGIAGLRARLGGTGPITTPQVPNPANPGGLPISILTRPTSLAGKGVDIALNNPITTGVLTAGALAGAIPDVDMESPEAKDIPFTLEERKELNSLMAEAAYNHETVFGEGGYSAFKKLDDPRLQLNVLRNAKIEGRMPEKVPSVSATSSSASEGIASSRANIMDEISEMLGSGDQALRDQQSAALIQLGAGIAGGDIAGGLSAAGKEVSALKAARSSEKLKAIMALIEMQYKEGLLEASEAGNLLDLIEQMREDFGEEGNEAKIDQLMLQLENKLGGMRNTGSQSATSFFG